MDAARRLIVIASAHTPAPPAGAQVVRFAGVSLAGEVAPERLGKARETAQTGIKTGYAAWLYAWARDSGAMNLAVWEGGLSWWWFAAMSERSPLRTALIIRLNRLLVVREVLKDIRPGHLTWHDDMAAMEAPVRALARLVGCDVDFRLTGDASPSLAKLAVRRVLAGCADLLRAMLLRWRGPDLKAMPDADVLFTTRFPVLWESQVTGWRERMMGKVPDAFEARGYRVGYVAASSGGVLAWLRNLHDWRSVMQARAIRPLRALVPLGEILRVQAMGGFWLRYLRWRRSRRDAPVMFDGLDVAGLFWSEMDSMVLDPDIPGTRLVARGLSRLVRQMPSLKYIVHPFEYQPLERGIWAGARANPAVKVIGLQTALATSGQLGFLPNAAEIRIADEADACKAPLPDLLMCYGALPASRFAAVIADRARDGGALRYGALANLVEALPDAVQLRAQLGLPAGAVAVMVACPIDANESWILVRGALALAEADDSIFLLFKFHYHTRLDDAVAVLADAAVPGRWRIFEAGLNDLILASDCVLSGATSVPYEALALRRPSLVYLPSAEWHTSKAAETPEVFLFWSSGEELSRRFRDLCDGRWTLREDFRKRALEQQMRLVGNAEKAFIDLIEDI